VIDLRSIVPLDRETILASVRRTVGWWWWMTLSELRRLGRDHRDGE